MMYYHEGNGMDGWVAASLARLDEANTPPWRDATSERTRTMTTWGTVNDYKTGTATRDATAAEWRKTATKLNGYDGDAYTGAWADEDRVAVYVSGGPEAEVTDDDIWDLQVEAGAAGDDRQAKDCERALGGDASARGRCVSVILDTRMEAASDAETSEERS